MSHFNSKILLVAFERGGGGGVGTDIGIKLLPMMWVFLCIPRHIFSFLLRSRTQSLIEVKRGHPGVHWWTIYMYVRSLHR